jgi:uncharacterized protein (DUF1778 family)
MGKTITIRIDDPTYRIIKSAAESERRTISNFMEYASLAYIESSNFLDNEEMQSITSNTKLIDDLNRSMDEIKRGKYRIIE